MNKLDFLHGNMSNLPDISEAFARYFSNFYTKINNPVQPIVQTLMIIFTITLLLQL